MEMVKRFKKTNYCVTETNIEVISFEWTINNFSFHATKNGYILKSSMFSSETEDYTQWYLEISPMGKNKESENFVSLYLHSTLNDKKDTLAKFKISLVNSIPGEANIEIASVPRQFDQKHRNWGWSKFVESESVLREGSGFLPNNTLTVHCEIDMLTRISTKSWKTLRETAITPSRSGLSDDLLCLLKNEVCSDVTLSAEGKHLKVHKSILAARSPIFAAMFCTDMKEKNQNVIELSDMDPDVLCSLLYFIYTGNAPDIESDELARNLLVAANKFLVHGLKKICEDALYSSIAVDNVIDFLQLADMHGADDLKAASLEYICCHISAVMKTRDWMTLMSQNLNLLKEVLEYNVKHDQGNA